VCLVSDLFRCVQVIQLQVRFNSVIFETEIKFVEFRSDLREFTASFIFSCFLKSFAERSDLGMGHLKFLLRNGLKKLQENYC
jgi:hypothetical protein